MDDRRAAMQMQYGDPRLRRMMASVQNSLSVSAARLTQPTIDSETEEDEYQSAELISRLANVGDNKLKVEKLDPKLIGMSVGYKSLYAVREDRRGRFQWQDTVPAVVKPAENAETQKWALVVRYVKEYTDPRKALAIHSIVVQSPLLKEIFETVLAGYPGVTVGLQRLEFSGKFESLIHRFPELNAEIDRVKEELGDGSDTRSQAAEQAPRAGSKTDVNSETSKQPVNGLDKTTEEVAPPVDEKNEITKESEDHLNEIGDGNSDPTGEDAKTETIVGPSNEVSQGSLKLKHAELLRDVLLGEFQSVIESSQDMKAKGVMTYDYLWTLFEPGHLVYCRQEGQDRVFKLQSAKYGYDRENHPVFWVTLSYIDFDGTKFGWARTKISMSPFQGTRAITSLAAYPLESHTDLDGLKFKLIERGSKIENFSGTHYRTYDGIGWKLDQWGHKERHSINGRIIIDAVGWNRYQPNSAIFVNRLDSKNAGKDTLITRTIVLPSELLDDCGGDFGGMPMDGHFAEEEDDQKSSQPLTDDHKLLCTHLLRGYALKEKMWLNLFVNSVHDITFNSHAFESLVLPENQKELILGFACTQQAYRTSEDVIQGKGRGIILLLCGPPGVGKTLTAESVAEEMKVPLFVMSAGDLGMDSTTIEARLLSILGMCTRWNAILLLDEADIFLEERSLHEVERNKLVSIFLRVLEYHESIMFLTTNRVQTFDPAFQSRIHISIDYPELSIESRRTVWDNFLKQHNITQAAARSTPPKDPASSIRSTAETETPDEETAQKTHESMTQPHAIEKKDIKELARVQLNGRQIKNVLKTAQLLATHKKEALRYSHVETVLDVTQHLHNSTQATKRAQGSIYH